MNVHNCYTIRWKSGCVTALNSVTEEFWRAVAEGGAWAKYMALYDERGGVKICPAKLKFLNSFPERGGNLRAVYSAAFECPQGEKYTKVAMLWSEDAGGTVSEAEIDYVSTGEPPEITAVIYLEFGHDEYTRLCEGDNELVRMLLGCATGKKLAMGYGTCSYPTKICTRDKVLRTDLDAPEITYGDDFIAFECKKKTSGTELFILADGTPAVRAVRPFTYEAVNLSGTVSRCGFYAGNRPAEIFNVYVDGNRILKPDCYYSLDSVLKVKNHSTGPYLGAEGALKSDPAEEYLAVIASSYVEVYKADVIDLLPLLRVPRDGEYVEMCRGGALAMWSDSTLTMYEPDDDGNYESFSYDIPRGSDCIVLREGYRYHAGYLANGTFVRVIFARTMAPVTLETKSVDLTQFVLARCGDAMMYNADTMSITLSDDNVAGEFATDKLKTVTGPFKGHGNYFALGMRGGDTISYNCAYKGNQLLSNGEYVPNGRLSYCGKILYVYDFYWGQRQVVMSGGLPEMTCACLAGNGLFLISDGRMLIYYINSRNMSVRIPVNYDGGRYTAVARQRVYQGDGKGARFVLRGD